MLDRSTRVLTVVVALVGMGLHAHVASAAPNPAALAYALTEGQNRNIFLQDGPVAAHVLLREGTQPRILVAFPAGDSGVGLWFEPAARAAGWRVERAPVPVRLRDGRGRALYGVRFTASTDATRLVPHQAVLSSIRYLRDYQGIGSFPPDIAVAPSATADTLDWRRDRIDGAPGSRLTLRVSGGHVDNGAIVAAPGGRITLEITAASGETPLTPFAPGALLNARAAPDPAARNALRFLSTREKFLAGSWRFNTYFGRDTLMSMRLLMPALQPAAIEAGLGAVLARVSAHGEVAHEEGIGEFAVIDNKAHGRHATDTPELDYKMIDGNYMLGPVAAAYLLDGAHGVEARAFLARTTTLTGASVSNGAKLVANLRYVVETARAFADAPGKTNLIAIKSGFEVGQWRDSDTGLGGGRYPYDVNAALTPAALEATTRLLGSGLLGPYLSNPEDRALLARAAAMAKVWRREAPPLFRVALPAAKAVPMLRAYALTMGVPAAPALAALGTAPLVFHALSLNADGSPVPILNSDEGFALMFGDPAPADLETYVGALMRPFPAGLMTPVGLLVANAALDSAQVQAKFTPAAYHGAVVWSWQQALFAAGLQRQLARRELPASTRARMVDAQTMLWRAIGATRAFANSELWSWAFRDGRYQVVPFGAGKADVDESDAAQLWSTVYLAVRPPASARQKRGHR